MYIMKLLANVLIENYTKQCRKSIKLIVFVIKNKVINMIIILHMHENWIW